MKVTREIGLDYGHTLPAHYDFCSQIHGHRARILATVEGNICNTQNDSSQGMVMDFKFLKEIMMNEIHNTLDHGFAVWKDDQYDRMFIVGRNKKYLLTDTPPTAEYLAQWAFNQIESKLPIGIKLISVVWYETPNSYAECAGNSTEVSS